MKKSLFLIFFVLFGLSPVFAYDYTIDAYDVKMAVSENRTFNILETITARFEVPQSTIYRYIPVSGEIKRGHAGILGVNPYKARVEDITVNEKFTKRIIGSNLRVKIGNPNVKLTGKKSYEIKYKYFMGNDPLKNKDEFYFNIIDDSWDVPIQNVAFAIKLPKTFDASKVGFLTGLYGKVGADKLAYKVKDNIIYGRYYGVLAPKEDLRIRVELPEGYFIRPFSPISLLVLAPLIFLIISYFMWFFYGRDKKSFEVLDFNPPDNINPVEMAYIYCRDISIQDISTLLIYLASKGYIRIEKGDYFKVKRFFDPFNTEWVYNVATGTHYLKGGEDIFNVFKDKDGRDSNIILVKPYDGNNPIEKLFLGRLFGGYDSIKMSELYSDVNMSEVLKMVQDNVKNSNSAFERGSFKKQIMILAFMIISFVLINIALCCEEIDLLPIVIFIMSFSAIGYQMSVYPVIRFLCFGRGGDNMVTLPAGLFWIIAATAILIVFFKSVHSYLVFYYVFGVFCIILMNVIYFYMPKWTEEGQRLYDRVLGFRKYLKRVEIQRLQKLVDEDPQYFYKILPFAFVLGLSKKWINKFKNIVCEPPSYYSSSNYSHKKSPIQ